MAPAHTLVHLPIIGLTHHSIGPARTAAQADEFRPSAPQKRVQRILLIGTFIVATVKKVYRVRSSQERGKPNETRRHSVCGTLTRLGSRAGVD